MCAQILLNCAEIVSFHPWYDQVNSDQLRKILGSAVPKAALMCNLTPKQIRQLLMDLSEEFFRYVHDKLISRLLYNVMCD